MFSLRQRGRTAPAYVRGEFWPLKNDKFLVVLSGMTPPANGEMPTLRKSSLYLRKEFHAQELVRAHAARFDWFRYSRWSHRNSIGFFAT